MITIEVSHNFETAHRLPFLEGKCENIHGHSWIATFNIGATQLRGGIDRDGISVEYGKVKKIIREWIDKYLDHGTMLGTSDPLVEADVHSESDDGPGIPVYQMLGKTFLFGRHIVNGTMQEPTDTRYDRLPWPTVEAVAMMLCNKIQHELDMEFDGQGLFVNTVHVQETAVNSALYEQGV